MTTATLPRALGTEPSVIETIRRLGPTFAERAAGHDADDSFVHDNYANLREARIFAAGVPVELGGGGASHRELSLLRELAHYCSSTALSLSMHTHQVAIPAYRWQQDPLPALEGLLRRVATDQPVLVSSGASDWLESSGVMTKVAGGYRYTGRKVFASGSPAGAIAMTSGAYDDPVEGPLALHFGLPLNTPRVTVLDNWRTLGMRATGSNDIVIEDAFIPDAAISLRRPRGKWAPIYDLVAMLALPLVLSVYVGVAEKARDIAVTQAARKRNDPVVQMLVGEMETELRTAQVALDSAFDIAESAKPGIETTNEVLMRRTIAGQAAMRTVSKAMDVAGGAAFHRATGLERLWRDVQGARYHPLSEAPQHLMSGRIALGFGSDSF